MSQTYQTRDEHVGKRLDVVVAELAGISRSQAQKRILTGEIRLNGVPAELKRPVPVGGVIHIVSQPKEVVPPAPLLTVLYEDADLMAIDKPAGLVVHASESGRIQPSVAEFARAQGVEDDDGERPGIVHRLDKDTSGVMLIAKHPKAKQELQRQFKARTVIKTYTALVRGHMTQPEAIIDLPIERDRQKPVKRAVVPGGRTAITQYRVVREYAACSLLEIDLKTGRTHQIRVHFSHVGHPVMGDTLYGDRQSAVGLSRQFLHASQLTFSLLSGQKKTVKSPLSSDLQAFLTKLDNQV